MKPNWKLAALAPLFLAAPALAANPSQPSSYGEHKGAPGVDVVMPGPDPAERAEHKRDARSQVDEAAQVVAKMKADAELAQEMSKARGIFVMPDYGRVALVVGGHAANGVLLVKQQGKWIGPALYNVGGLSIGAQAGASGGQAAFLLMTDKAVNQFKRKNDFALNADAGVTVVKWSAKAHARTGGDVYAWSDQVGAYAGVSIGVSDIRFDKKETAALYGRTVTASDVIGGRATPKGDVAANLIREMG